MTDSKNQLVSIDGEDVFLVLPEQTGSDFTFYLRNDDEAKLVCEVLRRASGESSPAPPATQSGRRAGDNLPQSASAVKGRPSKRKLSYSCRVKILKVLLDKDDLISAAADGEKLLLNELLEAKSSAAGDPLYKRLGQELPKTLAGLASGKLNDKNLIKDFLDELNELLATDGRVKGLLDDAPGKAQLTGDEEKLLAQVTDAQAQSRLSNYLKFCSLFKDAIKPLKKRLKDGRVLAGLAYEGQVWSLTFRKQDSKAGYNPGEETVSNLSDAKEKGFMNSIEEISKSLYEEIFYTVGHGALGDAGPEITNYRDRIEAHWQGPAPEVSGLVVIAGSTNSAKSQITRGLIHLYLKNLISDKKQDRRPHLVTFEDPIEKYYAERSYTTIGAHSQYAIRMAAWGEKVDYTPRQGKADVNNLKRALGDALRQTPKVFFVGETRERADWRELINFAGTGHLIITTAHAGSLVEAMHKIFLATGARTPADRSEIAGRLLAVVHLKRTEIGGYKYAALVPAVWRRVPRGVSALTSEGLASVLQHRHSDAKNPCSCLGRSYFADRLLELAKHRSLPRKVRLSLTKKAIGWDLEGV